MVKTGISTSTGRGAKPGKARALALCVLIFSLAGLAYAPGVKADRVRDKRNELERIKREVQNIDARLETITEQYNLTNVRAQQIKAGMAQKERELAALASQLEERKGILGRRLRELYKSGNADVLEVLTECCTMDDLYTNMDRARRISGNDVDIIVAVIGSRQQAESARAELQAKKAELDAVLAQLEAQRNQIEGELRRRKELMAGVEAEVNRLIAEEEASRAVTAPPRTTPRTGTSRPRTPPPPPPPYAPEVVKVAYAQLGKPYRYAAAGPDAFDCSGLVMYCYARVGVRLPHSSYMQARCGTPVSYSELQPGDLVFFRGFGHVGIYIGNGQYIHAPRTGDVVRIADLGRRRDFCGAVRIR